MKTWRLTCVLLILGLLASAAFFAAPALGATDPPLTIKTMKVSVWPEYDDSRVLVMYQGEFNDGSVFPQPVNFPVPLGSEINQVCALQPPKDDHLCQLYDTETGADSLKIDYTLPIPTFYLEYYWDGLKTQPDKSFSFRYVSPYAVDSLELEVQQPLQATGFKLDEPYDSATTDSHGLKYYNYVFKNVTAGEVIDVGASYVKPDDKPSVSRGQANSGGGSSNPYAVTGIGVAALAAVVIGFVLLKRRPALATARVSRAQARRDARLEAKRHGGASVTRPRPPEPPRAGPASAGQPAVFCYNCGAKLAAGASFCHLCGSKTKGAG